MAKQRNWKFQSTLAIAGQRFSFPKATPSPTRCFNLLRTLLAGDSFGEFAIIVLKGVSIHSGHRWSEIP